jgi:hypothetical protein
MKSSLAKTSLKANELNGALGMSCIAFKFDLVLFI